MFRAHVLIIRRSKLHYAASGIITPIGGRLVHRDKYTEMHGQQNVKILGVFAKLQKAAISFVMSVLPLVRPSVTVGLGSHWTDFH